jgi:hypothetical protein
MDSLFCCFFWVIYVQTKHSKYLKSTLDFEFICLNINNKEVGVLKQNFLTFFIAYWEQRILIASYIELYVLKLFLVTHIQWSQTYEFILGHSSIVHIKL